MNGPTTTRYDSEIAWGLQHGEVQQQGPSSQRPVNQTAAQVHDSFLTFISRTQSDFLMLNPLSSQWKADRLQQAGHWKTLPAFYLCGMAGYFLALPVRAAVLVVTAFDLIKTFFATLILAEFSKFTPRMKKRTWVLLGATGELTSGVIGVACPPLAYKFDEWIQKNDTIHSWYNSNWLSFWRYDRNLPEIFSSNDERMKLKKGRVTDFLHCFKEAKVSLGHYIKADFIDGMDVAILKKIAAIGLLNAHIAGKPLSVFIKEAIAKCDAKEQQQKKDVLEGDLKAFNEYWEPLVKREENGGSTFEAKQLAEWITYEFILDSGDEQPEDYFSNVAVQENLKKSLESLENTPVKIGEKELSLRNAIHKLYLSICQFSENITSTDREMFRIVGKAAYE